MTNFNKNTNILLLALLFNFIFVNETLASPPKDIVHSNISGSKVTICWITDVSETSQINYGTSSPLGNTAYDVRGESFQGTTHYITITGLTQDTTYYYDIVSGGVTYDNGGAHYTVTTGAALSPTADSDIAYVQVFLSDGATPAKGAIVYIELRDNDSLGTSGDSQIRSSLVDNTGYCYADLKNVRNQFLDSYFDYSESGDSLVLNAQIASEGAVSQTVDTVNDSPAPAMILPLGIIDVKAGWNLIALPVTPSTPYTASTLIEDINNRGGTTQEVDRWYDAGWDGHIGGLPFNDFDIEIGKGYFVRCNSPSTWTVTGTELDITSIPLDAGWTLISLPNPGYVAQTLIDDINSQGGTAQEVDRWYDAGWSGHINGLPFNNFEIEVGKGYFVRCDSASTFNPQ